MKCSHFNRYIDNGWTDRDEFIEHLASCESCSKKYDELLNAYSEYEEIFKHDCEPIDVSPDVMKVINRGKKRIASKRLSVAAAILVLFGSIFVYRENFISFALEIPGISMIVKNMIGEGYLESAIENGEGVYDLVYEKDGYTLYIKDLYVTNDFAGFKYSITAPNVVNEDLIFHLYNEKQYGRINDFLNFKGGKKSQWKMQEFSIGEKEMVNGTAEYSVAILSKATEETIVEFPSVAFVSQSDKTQIDRTYVINQMVEIKDYFGKTDQIYLDRIEDNGYFMNLYYKIPEESNLIGSFASFKALKTKEGSTYRLLSADMCSKSDENNQQEYFFTLDGSMASKDFSLEGLEIELESIHKTSYGHEIPMNKENKSGVIINSFDVTSAGYNVTLSVNGTIVNVKNFIHKLVVKLDDDYYVVQSAEGMENVEVRYEYDLTRTEVEELTGYSIEWMYEELEDFKKTQEYDLLHNYISSDYEPYVIDEAIYSLYYRSSISIKAWEHADCNAKKGDVITYSSNCIISDEVDVKDVKGFYDYISYYNNGGSASFSIKEIIDN